MATPEKNKLLPVRPLGFPPCSFQLPTGKMQLLQLSDLFGQMNGRRPRITKFLGVSQNICYILRLTLPETEPESIFFFLNVPSDLGYGRDNPLVTQAAICGSLSSRAFFVGRPCLSDEQQVSAGLSKPIHLRSENVWRWPVFAQYLESPSDL